MFLENKYTRWYYNIIANAKNKEQSGYTERHHIIPRGLGGLDNSSNIIVLKAREHYICHLLLTKMVVGEDKTKMVYAFWILSNRLKQKRSKVYENLRQEFSELMKKRKHSNESKAKISAANKGKKISEAQKQHLREINIGRKRHVSDQHRENLSKANKGRIVSDETKRKLSIANKGQGKGRTLLDETKEKLSNLAKRRSTNGTHNFSGPASNQKLLAEGRHPTQRTKTCAHCGVSMNLPLFGRYHGDKCSKKLDS